MPFLGPGPRLGLGPGCHRGPPFGSPNSKDQGILASILGALDTDTAISELA